MIIEALGIAVGCYVVGKLTGKAAETAAPLKPGSKAWHRYMESIKRTSKGRWSDGREFEVTYYGDEKSHAKWNRKNGFE
jgi:hypothetical protein